MATSLSAQLQSIRSVTKISYDTLKRPITRPSILFSPKEAADIDTETIFTISLSGLDVLITMDAKFKNYKNDLFAEKSKDLNRELFSEKESQQINAAIASYLRLLSGYLEVPGSLKTLEYLIRKYMVHIYNVEDLILCALPYHETHIFVQIVQLLDIRNGRWKFLDGVKVSGAPPPRNVLVQQCMRDMGVLEAIFKYATHGKKYQPSRQVVSFCTAVAMEVLGSLATVDSDFITRLFPFIYSGLQPKGPGSSDHKASALMVISLLSNKVSLSPKLVKSLLRSISEIALVDAKDIINMQWLRFSLMALINLVQLQHVDLLPRKVLESLKEIRDIDGILAQLSREYNIDKFVYVVLESVVEYSLVDDTFHLFLESLIETIPSEIVVCRLISKIISSCWRVCQKDSNRAAFPSEGCLSKTLKIISAKYPKLFHQSVQKYFQDNKLQTENGEISPEIFCNLLNESLGESLCFSDTKKWFSLHHPKVEIRRAALLALNISDYLREDGSLQMFPDLRDTILRQLYDTDLTIVKAALSIKGITKIVTPSDLMEALNVILARCISTMMPSSPDKINLPHDVAALFLHIALSNLCGDVALTEKLASAMFPALLVFFKTQRLNVKVLEFGKKINWPLYHTLSSISLSDNLMQPENIADLNVEIVDNLAETFSASPSSYIGWLSSTSNQSNTAKTLYLIVLMQAIIKGRNEWHKLSSIYDACFSILSLQLKELDMSDDSITKVGGEILQWDCKQFLHQMDNCDTVALNKALLIIIFWRLVEGLAMMRSEDSFMDYNEVLCNRLKQLFTLFASSVKKQVYQDLLRFIAKNCNVSPADFLSYFFTQGDVSVTVQVESLKFFASICSDADDAVVLQFLANLPCLFVPLASNNQDLKAAAMSCIEEFCSLSHRVCGFSKKNGNNASWYNFVEDLLKAIIQQKRMILSDKSFLNSFLTSLLGSSCNGLRVATNVEQRFDERSKSNIIGFILHCTLQRSDFAKLTILSLLKGLGPKILHVRDVKELLTKLLQRRNSYLETSEENLKLTETEVLILCILLEICSRPVSLDSPIKHDDFLLKGLRLDGLPLDKFYASEPCIVSLRVLSDQFFNRLGFEKQELFFRELVKLYSCSKVDIQNETREALLRLNISHSVVLGSLQFICKLDSSKTVTSARKKQKFQQNLTDTDISPVFGNSILLSSLSSLLDILMLKNDISGRELLIGPLFKLLERLFSNDFTFNQSVDGSDTLPTTLYFVKHTLLLLLEDIIGSMKPNQIETQKKVDILSLLRYARSEKDDVTRNHIFSLLTTVAKVASEEILANLVDILTVIGESTMTLSDCYSQRVFEEFVAAVVPRWLERTNSSEKLLKIFINVLPKVADHRRTSIMVFVLRNMGEQSSLAPLLALLFESLVETNKTLGSKNSSFPIIGSWEFLFAKQICEQYSCHTWLPSLVTFVELVGNAKSDCTTLKKLECAFEFVLDKLHDPELTLKLESSEAADQIHTTYQNLMEHVVSTSTIADSKPKKESPLFLAQKEVNMIVTKVLRRITTNISPSAYFRAITNLLSYSNELVKNKALAFLSEMIKSRSSAAANPKGVTTIHDWHHFKEITLNDYEKLCLKIVDIIDSEGEVSAVKCTAVATIEALVQLFPSSSDVYSLCLPSIAKSIKSSGLDIVGSSLRSAGALVHVLGPKCLPEIPLIMESLFSKFSTILELPDPKNISTKGSSNLSKESLLLSVLVALEAVVDKLGAFLNPYLFNIVELLVLHPDYTSKATSKIKQKADTVRRLLTERISMRLILPPLTKMYPNLIISKASNLVIAFQMLESFVSRMDRPSVAPHYKKIFEFCLQALDLRGQHLSSIKRIDEVEESVINAMISLSMKLTETMFKPIFIRVIEWSESVPVDNLVDSSAPLDRKISFYHLVNRLAETHRSLFVPYFKYLLDSCVQHLIDVGDYKDSSLLRKKKKMKIETEETNPVLNWHLRALVTSALHKCFLYDAGAVKFLDSSNFEQLLKPLVSQLAIEPPPLLEDHQFVPSVDKVDEILVLCIGQMAVTAGTDLLWKPLNHEVLLQTRSEKIRTRMLSLKIVKYLLDHLKEEYLVLLPETLPFLAELLEDVELPVKSLTQDIIKEMELLSGENLRQYLL